MATATSVAPEEAVFDYVTFPPDSPKAGKLIGSPSVRIANREVFGTPLAHLLLHSALKNEPRWLEIGERCAELVQFCCRTVELQPREIGDFQHRAELRFHIGKMREHGLGIRIGFAAEDHVTIDRELVVMTRGLGFGPGDKHRQKRFRRIELAGVDFEIWVNADGG